LRKLRQRPRGSQELSIWCLRMGSAYGAEATRQAFTMPGGYAGGPRPAARILETICYQSQDRPPTPCPSVMRHYRRPLAGPELERLHLELEYDYALEVADRILHDRELCNFIARTVMDIGFDGETEEGLRKQWVERERWPATVRSILLARDRGKCASCGIDIVQELLEAGHVDHMFPIGRGGCNDVVNLQLLCSKCNLTKGDEITEIANSVPRYIRRRTPKTPTSPAPGERRHGP
jgi:HNH endonuclease